MHNKNKFKPNTKQLIGIVLSLVLILSQNFSVFSQAENIPTQEVQESHTGESLEDQLKAIKDQLDAVRKEKETLSTNKVKEQGNISNYQKQIQTLQQQIENLDIDIQEKELIISELILNIEILKIEIEKLETDIVDATDQIDVLGVETNKRLLNMYVAQKQNSSSSSAMFSSEGPSSFIKSDIYRHAMQNDTNNKISLLVETKKQLELDMVRLEDDKISIERDKNTLDEQKRLLEINQYTAQEKSKEYQGLIGQAHQRILGYDEVLSILPQKEKDLLEKEDQIKDSMLKRKEVVNGVAVKKGTFLGIEGNTGYSYGAHLHFGISIDGVIQNPCNYLPAGAYGSCGGNGTIGMPLSPSGVLTSGFRTTARPTHNAIDVSSGGGSNVNAAHDGYAYFFFEACPSWAPVCNNGGANAVKVCDVDKCNSGKTTIYYHLKCTAEPASSPRSCKR